jgi:hypothetical protein
MDSKPGCCNKREIINGVIFEKMKGRRVTVRF